MQLWLLADESQSSPVVALAIIGGLAICAAFCFFVIGLQAERRVTFVFTGVVNDVLRELLVVMSSEFIKRDEVRVPLCAALAALRDELSRYSVHCKQVYSYNVRFSVDPGEGTRIILDIVFGSSADGMGTHLKAVIPTSDSTGFHVIVAPRSTDVRNLKPIDAFSSGSKLLYPDLLGDYLSV